MNIECSGTTLDELKSAFRFNDAVIRNLILKRDEAVTEQSALAKARDDRDGDGPRGDNDDDRPPRRNADDDAETADKPAADEPSDSADSE